MSDLQSWIPVIIAILTTLTALFQWLGKNKAVKVTEVLVDQVENFADDDLKRNIRDAADIHNVGDALHLIVSKVTK